MEENKWVKKYAHYPVKVKGQWVWLKHYYYREYYIPGIGLCYERDFFVDE